MRYFFVTVFVALVSTISPASAASSVCNIVVRNNVEIAGPDFSLADVLAPGTCAPLLDAASQVRFGKTPLAGSPRVITGDDIQALLLKTASLTLLKNLSNVVIDVPQRVIVRRVGGRASCKDIGDQFPQAPPGKSAAPIAASAVAPSYPRSIGCGASGRIPLHATLEFGQPAWDPLLKVWQLSARCAVSSECVPFLVRMNDAHFTPELVRPSTHGSSPSARHPIPHSQKKNTLVRPGERVILVWDQAGIRLNVPGVCLDRGDPGQVVRVRLINGGRVMTAVVIAPGLLGFSS
jgi:hypothetical protein